MKTIRTIPRLKPVIITEMKRGEKFMTSGEVAVLIGWAFDEKEFGWVNVKYLLLNDPGQSRIGCFFHHQRCLKYLGEVIPERNTENAAA